MKNSYFPKNNECRMKNAKDIETSRKYFFEGKNRVLYHLVQQRFLWMNDYIKDDDKIIIELGCGAGLSKEFINNPNLVLTDIVKHEWTDKYEDALNIDYPDESIDVIICSHMIHHLSNPALFIDNIAKKLKTGGRIIIQDIYTCALMKFALRIMCHEGWSDTIDVFDRKAICNNPSDPWSANCSIPKLLFKEEMFAKQFPQYNIIKNEKNECFLFLLSGGVIAKTYSPPIGDIGAKILQKMDKFFVNIAPSIFACGCSVVLEKK